VVLCFLGCPKVESDAAPLSDFTVLDTHPEPRPAPEAPPPLQMVTPLDEGSLARMLANAEGSTLVLNVWATWCGPCVEELPAIAAVAGRHPGVRFALVSVDDPRDRARVGPFVHRLGVRLPVYHLLVEDAAASLSRVVAGWPSFIPVTLVVEPGGGVRARLDGQIAPAELERLLGQGSP
jgi:thiol-disulfide isomerase/thioredoxin